MKNTNVTEATRMPLINETAPDFTARTRSPPPVSAASLLYRPSAKFPLTLACRSDRWKSEYLFRVSLG